mmetsp:Transcript_10651/g.25409  ORF Transcript_10651/g.25409 Transcript_10651/m.25409 type:complete len:146 (+) Transcript_10651:67-504(+)
MPRDTQLQLLYGLPFFLSFRFCFLSLGLVGFCLLYWVFSFVLSLSSFISKIDYSLRLLLRRVGHEKANLEITARPKPTENQAREETKPTSESFLFSSSPQRQPASNWGTTNNERKNPANSNVTLAVAMDKKESPFSILYYNNLNR